MYNLFLHRIVDRRIWMVLALALCVFLPVSAQRADYLARFTVDGMKTIATTRDGRYIATAGTDSLIRIWDAATGAQVQAFPRKDTVITVAFLPGDTTLLLVGARDSAFHIWNWRNGEVLRTEKLYRPILQAMVTDDGTMLAIWVTYPEDQLEFWSIESGTYQKVVYKGKRKSNQGWMDNSATQIQEWDGTGRIYLTHFDPPSTRVVYLGSGIVALPGHFSPEGRHMVVPSEQITPRVYDIATLDTLFSLDSSHAHDQIYRAFYHPDGGSIITIGQSLLAQPNSRVVMQRWRATDGAYIDTVAVLDSVFRLPPWILFSRDGSLMVVYSDRPGKVPVTTWRLHDATNEVPSVVAGINGSFMRIAPNPAATSIRIRTIVPESGSISYSIHDYLGRQLVSWSASAGEPGVHGTDLDVTGLASGLYFCRMQIGSHISTASFVVQR